MPYTCDSYRHFNVEYFILTAPNINTFVPREEKRAFQTNTPSQNYFGTLRVCVCVCACAKIASVAIYRVYISTAIEKYERKIILNEIDWVCVCIVRIVWKRRRNNKWSRKITLPAMFHRIKSIVFENNNWMYSVLLQKFPVFSIWNFHEFSLIKEEEEEDREKKRAQCIFCTHDCS